MLKRNSFIYSLIWQTSWLFTSDFRYFEVIEWGKHGLPCELILWGLFDGQTSWRKVFAEIWTVSRNWGRMGNGVWWTRWTESSLICQSHWRSLHFIFWAFIPLLYIDCALTLLYMHSSEEDRENPCLVLGVLRKLSSLIVLSSLRVVHWELNQTF